MSSRLLRWRRRLPGYDRKCEDPLEGGETQVSACACMAFCVDEAMPVLARAACASTLLRFTHHSQADLTCTDVLT